MIEVGSQLKNGATVISLKESPNKKVVLADFSGDHPSATPYVTWRMDVNDNCFWGHYFKTLEEAEADFATR